ncbi:MAG: hypothetical protein ACRDQ4_13605 [Pseudonocardiaceae bacterium]
MRQVPGLPADTAVRLGWAELLGWLRSAVTDRLGVSVWVRVEELERLYRAYEISNNEFADREAGWFAGVDPRHLWEPFQGAACIGGLDGTLAVLAEAGCRVLLGTVAWRFVADLLKGPVRFRRSVWGRDGIRGQPTVRQGQSVF